jgi:hypothetical protein
MNTFEKCQSIRRIIVNRAAEVIAYQGWDNDFAAKQIRDLPKEIKRMKGGKEVFGIQPAELTEEQMVDLGFGRWSKENPMRLIPLWLLPFLAEEIDCECIDGEKKLLKKSDMDNDNRGGCLAYGVIPKSAK